MTGADKLNFRSNDDGEPFGTAGRPILGQIQSRDLTNVLVVVVRYFGGVLLGTGGLVIAYKMAASDALDNAEMIEKQIVIQYKLNFPYLQMNHIMKIIKDLQIKVLVQHFEINCEIKLEVNLQMNENFIQRISDIDELKFEII